MLENENYKNTFIYYRKTRRLTHQEMAEFIGCHRLRYRRIEEGQHNPSDHEWANFIRGSRFPQLQRSLAFPDFAHAQFLLPSEIRGQAFVNYRVGNIFQQLLIKHSDENQWHQLLKILNIPAVYFNNTLNPYPYALWLRVVERCRLSGLLNDQPSINTFAQQVIFSKDWWGSKWPAFQELGAEERFDVCLNEWRDRSLNHEVITKKLSSQSSSLQIKLIPKASVPQELYFHNPILKDFFPAWVCGLLKAISHGPHYLTFEKEKQSWLITAIRG